jgi:L-iditol 2-dehydrogenase
MDLARATGAETETVRFLRYQLTIPTYLATQAAGRFLPGLLASGRIPGLTYTHGGRLALPGPDWLRLRPRLAGICGSDIALLTAKSSPALSPFTSFPAVLGHEVVAQVSETGDAVRGVRLGDRVVVDPVISCQVRGLEQCVSCLQGQAALCLRAADGPLAPGMLAGFCRDLPGAWSEEMVVHRSQVYPVPPEVSDEVAVLIEPLSVGLHAVLRLPPEPGSRVLVVGAGTVGLCVVAALRLLAIPCSVTVVARYAFQAQVARTLGADVVILSKEGGAEKAAIQETGARAYRPLRGRSVYAGGFDWIYECVGSPRSLDDSLHVAGPRGKVVVVGCPAEIPRLDWTFVWARELHVVGSYVYAQEPAFDGAHTFEVALRLLAEHPTHPIAGLVTHRFPLSQWREALGVSLGRGRHGAIKVVFSTQAQQE